MCRAHPRDFERPSVQRPVRGAETACGRYAGVGYLRSTSSQNWRVLFKQLREMRNCSRRSNLELRGPRSSLN
eukprot:5808160-Alexandrium_andersonii.AAC.1